jgi:hypothetical protein
VKDYNGYGLDPKITPERVEKLITAFGVGCALEDAAAYAAMNPRTLRRWMDKGAAGEDPYREVFEQLHEARAQGIVHSQAVLFEAKEWQAHRARLAMLRPEAYSERRIEQKTVTVNHYVHIAPEALEALDDDELELQERLLEKMHKARPELVEGELVGESENGASHKNGGSVT